jgi:hypothetical protein
MRIKRPLRERFPERSERILNTESQSDHFAGIAVGSENWWWGATYHHEAGPCGYGLYRQLQRLDHAYEEVSSSQIPKKPDERIKTDRRDACKLVRTLRSVDITAVQAPDEEQEVLRD